MAYVIYKLPIQSVLNNYRLKNSFCEPIILSESPPYLVLEHEPTLLDTDHSNEINTKKEFIFQTAEDCRTWIKNNIKQQGVHSAKLK